MHILPAATHPYLLKRHSSFKAGVNGLSCWRQLRCHRKQDKLLSFLGLLIYFALCTVMK